MGENRIEAQHGAGSGDADDHLAIFKAAGGELEIAAADQIEAAGILALGKERSLRGKGDGAGGQLKIGQNGAAQGAEPAGAAIGAGRASHRNRLGRCFFRACTSAVISVFDMVLPLPTAVQTISPAICQPC